MHMNDVRRAGLRLGCALFAVYGAVVQAADPAGKAAAPAQVPPLQVEPLAAGSLAKLGLGLFVVIALIVALSWAMRRMGGLAGTTAGSLRILGGLSMGTRERVVLIQVGDTQLLLGVAPGRVQTLHVLEQPIQTPQHTDAAKSGFAASLSAALQRGKSS
ncbi:MAG TPA: flagellar biosynthetic protein FliO [Gammaproteobacteria bacterium]